MVKKTVTEELMDWSKIHEEEIRAERKLFNQYRKLLRGLINVSGLFRNPKTH